MFLPAIQSEPLHLCGAAWQRSVARCAVAGRHAGRACFGRVRDARAVLVASAADVIGQAL